MCDIIIEYMKTRLRSLFISFIALFLSASFLSTPVFATPEPSTNSDSSETTTVENEDDGKTVLQRIDEAKKAEASKSEEEKEEDSKNSKTPTDCYKEVSGLGWLICPGAGFLSKVLDGTYSILEKLIAVKPISTDTDSPIHYIWAYLRGITNFIFIVLLLVVAFSHVTGVGIKNYHIKRILPRLVVAAILVNLSYIICVMSVDLSNILGTGIKALFDRVAEEAAANSTYSEYVQDLSATNVVTTLLGVGGGTVVLGLAFAGGIESILWYLLPILFAGAIAILSAVVTIAARQGLIYLLIMVSPLAFVAYMLPNTEQWFKKWYKLLFRMLIFYPTFAVLYGASKLAGFVIITSATDGFGVILGIAVQIMPLFLTIPLMRMSGTILSKISSVINMPAKPIRGSFNTYAQQRRQMAQGKQLMRARPTLTGAMYQSLELNKAKRAFDLNEMSKSNNDAYSARAFASTEYVDKDGKRRLTARGRRYYSMQARRIQSDNIRQATDADYDQGFSTDAAKSRAGKIQIQRANEAYERELIESDIIKARKSVVSLNNTQGRANKLYEAINRQDADISKQIYDAFNYDSNDGSEAADKARTQARNAVLANAISAKRKLDKEAVSNFYELISDAPPSSIPKTQFSNALASRDYNAMEAALKTLIDRGDFDQIEEVLVKQSGDIYKADADERDLIMQKHLNDMLLGLKNQNTRLYAWAKANNIRRGKTSHQKEQLANNEDIMMTVADEHGNSHKVPSHQLTLATSISYDDFKHGRNAEGDIDLDEAKKLEISQMHKDINDTKIVVNQERTTLKQVYNDIIKGNIETTDDPNGFIPIPWSEKQVRSSLASGQMDGEKLEWLNKIVTGGYDKRFNINDDQNKYFREHQDQVANYIKRYFVGLGNGQLVSSKSGTMNAMSDAMIAIDGRVRDYVDIDGKTKQFSQTIYDILETRVQALSRDSQAIKRADMNPSIRKMLGLPD